ncbi:Trans-aconitate 3-methyltransferase [Lachnellula willkommii]|uniref:Trans-aconitate 3-methyltransferase n=1 Tax=Lachnellula willkommii TaxID=215461 RepID=A0A559MBU8_9HELO|nr:Trans-aconitate 3-methyltransferase [Lachnellula willkommii]
MASATPNVTDPTFRSYSSEQAKAYASHRKTYDPAVYKTISDFHAANGGQFGLVVDCGCGPGNATRDLALMFEHALGTDAGAAMIDAAREKGGKTKSGADISFEVVPAESFSQAGGLEPESVDVLTVASMDFLYLFSSITISSRCCSYSKLAVSIETYLFSLLLLISKVHWFDLNKFYAEAAKVLKPGGTMALWTIASDPDQPNAAKLRETMLRFKHVVIGKYQMPGNLLAQGMYDNLPLPWTVSPPVPSFSKSDYVKHDYDRDGILSNGKTFFSGGKARKLADIEQALATASVVTRWREAHPDLVGTEQDCVKVFVKDLREALGGKDEVFSGGATTILLFKKSA